MENANGHHGERTPLSRISLTSGDYEAAYRKVLPDLEALDPGNTADLRQRAYTLLVSTYDQVRRVVVYLRWEHGDADLIAPSLYAGRQHRRKDPAPRSDSTPLPALTVAPETPPPAAAPANAGK